MAQEHSHIPVASSRASSIDMSPHNTHSRRLAPATQASSDSLTSHELTNLQPNPHTEALDSAISLLTGFTSQQLASISKLIHFTVKTALEERLDLTAPCADPAAVTDSMPGRRIAKVVSSVVKNALDELHNSSMTDDAPLSMALVACDQDVEPTQSAQTHLPQVPPSKSQAHSVSAESSQDVPPDSQHIQIRDFQSNEHQVKYRTDYPRLLVNAPRDHPRIIDISSVSDEISQRGLGFADLVVTILFMYDPRLLSDFLDLSKSHFDFRRISTSQSILVPFIERRIKFVTVCISRLIVIKAC